ncbi:PAS domain-containing protein [Thiomicrorhabdus sp. 6S2-11]|uniref:protein-glutamate O-methyltransferase n=2 Tax=Thiomicrorhabdus marina TaxID=2818442 RepID=A0ABS3Q6A6_9GAMM|nr:PAS domain-containing protein [Thiomicrorhabdus marina]
MQDPNTAKYDGMPNAAINSGNVDLILPPEEIGPELKNISSFPFQASLGLETNLSKESYFKILNILKKRFKIDFTLYKKSTIMRRIERRMTALKISKVEEYVEHLMKHKNEVELLFNDMLIGVTSFFRDARAFNVLQEELSLYLEKKDNTTIRVWTPGCCTGEEPYSIAIILSEILGAKFEDYKIQIFATDIDKHAVEFARNGIYPESALHKLPDKIKRKYFTVNGAQFQVIKPIKMSVIFSVHDVTVDPPFLRLDLLSCRNLLIYFNLELQRQVIPLFHYALNPQGLLFLGQSESIGVYQDTFRTISKNGKIFEASFIGKKTPPETKKSKAHLVDFAADMPKIKKENIASNANKITDTLGDLVTLKTRELILPHSILINDNMDIVYSKGKNPLLLRPEGLPTNNIFQNLHPSLSIDLRSAIHVLGSEQSIVKTAFQKLTIDKETYWTRLILIEIEHQAGMGRLVLILCQIEDVLDLPLSKPSDNDTDSTLYQEQERQLIKAKEQLQTVIEELETSNEEMQSMNEELQSSNEELQSSNEELETTNEELQSTNEELQTAYAELRIAYEDKDHQQTELEQLANELERTNTLLIDAESLGKTGSFRWDIPKNTMAWSQGVFKLFGLDIEKYQPTYEALVGIIYPEDRSTFEEFIENVLTMKNPQTISFRALNSEKEILWLKLEVAASFNNLKQAEYVMGTLTDVSEMAQARDEIDRQQTFTDILLNNSLGGVFIYDFKTGCNSFINPAYTKLLGYTLDDLKNLDSKAFMDLFHPDDLSSVLQHIEKVKASNVGETFVIRYRIKHKSSKDYIMVHSKDTLFSTATSSKKPNAMMGIFMEISDVENGDLKITEN